MKPNKYRRHFPTLKQVRVQARPTPPQTSEVKLLRDERYPGHAVLQIGPKSFLIFLLSHEPHGAVIHAMAEQLIFTESQEEAFDVVRQMHEFNEKQRAGLLVPSRAPIQPVRQDGNLLKGS